MTRTLEYLVTRLEEEHTRLAKTVSGISEADMQTPGVEGDWTVKDLVAHMARWDRRGAQWITATLRREKNAIPDRGVTWDQVDTLNRDTYEQNRHRPTGEVVDELEAAYKGLLSVISELREEDLNKTHRMTGKRSSVSIRKLIEWRYAHWQHHGGQIRKWLKEKDAPQLASSTAEGD